VPDSDFNAVWDAFILDQGQKDRLRATAVLNFSMHGEIDRAQLPTHGLILPHGAPGTGKTSIARSTGARCGCAFPARHATLTRCRSLPDARSSRTALAPWGNRSGSEGE
jgi:hypothetical protein